MSQANLIDALVYIEANFDKTVSLAQLADLSALSVSRFATVFREQFGLSPYKYLCELRVQRAQTLLLAGVPGRSSQRKSASSIRVISRGTSSAYAA